MDIVKRLREQADSWLSFGWDTDDIFDDAANEIEKLREERNQLRKVLLDVLAKEYVADCKDVARAALKESE